MRTFVWAICIFVFACTHNVVQADEAVDKLLRESSERSRALRTLTARIDLNWQSGGRPLQRNVGTISLMKPNYALIKLSGDYPLVTIASDSRSRYHLSDPTKYTLAAADRSGKNIDTPWWMFPVRFFFIQNLKPFGPDSPDWNSERYVGEEVIEHAKFSVIEVSGDKPMAYVARFYFDAGKILRRSVVRFGEGPGAAIYTCVIEDVRSPKHLRPLNFKYRPPVTAKLDTGAESRMLALGDQGPDFSLPTVDGKQLNLASVRQVNRATLINFWYLACPPCRAEFEFFQQLYSSLRTKGFSIIAINNIDEPAAIQTYMRQNRLTFPVVLGERDGPGVFGAYKVETCPSTYLLNSEGKIVYRSVGVDEAGLRKALSELLEPQQTQPKTYQFINGRWFDGRTFTKKVFYSKDGRLTLKRPRRIDETIDLGGGFVVPPFGDAHCHHFDSSYNITEQVNMYLRDGVFYAAVQTDVRSGAVKLVDKINKPTSVDVAYSHGALTSSYGHGVEIYEGLALFRRAGPTNADEVKKVRESHLRENDAYYIIDTVEDLQRKWPDILNGRPDFIKIYLLTSEEYEKRKNRTDTVGDRGVDPKLVPLIVKKAHAASLRVSAHVDTVTDYRTALKAGVDEMAHLPGYYVAEKDDPNIYRLTEMDAKETANRKVWVIVAPVAYQMFDPKSPSYDAKLTERTDAVRVHNLKLLKSHGARIAFGSDRYGSTPVNDVLYLSKLSIFSNLELLKIWSEAAPQMVFPHRKIGRLTEGYEASFLVLAGNPLEDFKNVTSIRLRFKQGIPLPQP